MALTKVAPVQVQAKSTVRPTIVATDMFTPPKGKEPIPMVYVGPESKDQEGQVDRFAALSMSVGKLIRLLGTDKDRDSVLKLVLEHVANEHATDEQMTDITDSMDQLVCFWIQCRPNLGSSVLDRSQCGLSHANEVMAAIREADKVEREMMGEKPATPNYTTPPTPTATATEQGAAPVTAVTAKGDRNVDRQVLGLIRSYHQGNTSTLGQLQVMSKRIANGTLVPEDAVMVEKALNTFFNG